MDYEIENKSRVVFEKPNYTQTPNILFDELMKEMSESELKVTLCIIRKIVGYHKFKPEAVSLSQIQEMTGLSRQGASDGLEQALARGTIARAGTGKRGVSLFQLVHKIDQSTEETRTSQQSRPELVNKVDTQKKTIKKIEKENYLDEPLQEMLDTVHRELKQYGKQAENVALLLLGRLNGKQAEMNLAKPIDAEMLKKFCIEWDKKKDRNGAQLTRPRNMGSVKSAVEAWQETLSPLHYLAPTTHTLPRKAPVNLDMLERE